MIPVNFKYLRPRSLPELFEALAKPDSRPLAGGTDLVLALRDEKANPGTIVDIKALPELRGITLEDGGVLRIGAAEPVQAVAEHPLARPYTALVQGAGSIGCYDIRWRATIGGNLCNGSPSADSAPGLLVYDAGVELLSAGGSRNLKLRDFLLGPGKVDIRPGEIMSCIRLPAPAKNSRSRYYRCSRVKGMDLSGLAAAVYCEGLSGFRVALGAAWPTVARAIEAEAILNGGDFTPELLKRATDAILNDIRPRASSMRASPEHKRAMIPELIKRGIEEMNGGVVFE